MAVYKKHEEIGGGGFGVVYRATGEDGRDVAWKELRKPYASEMGQRFIREMRLQSSLSHPNVMPIIASNDKLDPPAFIMPLAARSLRSIMVPGLEEETAVGIFAKVLQGIEHAHANGVIHGDIKPENVMLMPDDNPFSDTYNEEVVVVADFGFCRATCRDTVTLTLTGQGMGTAWYVAPEQWDNAKERDDKADIYSLGRLLYEMLTLTKPGLLDLQAVPNHYRYLVTHATQDDPQARYDSVASMLSDLTLVTQGQAPFMVPTSQLDQLAETILNADPPSDHDANQMIRLFFENADDATFIRRLALIPPKVASALAHADPAAFRRLLSLFDPAVGGSLGFSFTDKVADFYARVADRPGLGHTADDCGAPDGHGIPAQ